MPDLSGSPLISFRPLRLSDCNDNYLAWLHDPEVNQFLEIEPSEITLDTLRQYVVSSHPPKRYNFAVIASDNHIGNASIYSNPRDPADTFQTGWLIGNKEYWGSHTSSQIMYLLFQFGFIVLDKEQCIGSVYRSHIKARMSNRYVGFREVGVSTFTSRRHGTNLEVIDLEITRNEWNIRRSQLQRKHPEIYIPLTLDNLEYPS